MQYAFIKKFTNHLILHIVNKQPNLNTKLSDLERWDGAVHQCAVGSARGVHAARRGPAPCRSRLRRVQAPKPLRAPSLAAALARRAHLRPTRSICHSRMYCLTVVRERHSHATRRLTQPCDDPQILRLLLSEGLH